MSDLNTLDPLPISGGLEPEGLREHEAVWKAWADQLLFMPLQYSLNGGAFLCSRYWIIGIAFRCRKLVHLSWWSAKSTEYEGIVR